MLIPTPERSFFLGPTRRPYFLWDCDLDLDALRAGLADHDPEVRAYLLGKIMRQAKPDDVFRFTTRAEIRANWPRLQRYLGRTRGFWEWILARWDSIERAHE